MGKKKTFEDNLIWRAGHKTVSAIITFCLFATVALVFVIVLLRYVLKMNIYGADELVTVVTMWMYFLGATYGSFEESHIQGDLLSVAFKKGWQKKAHQLYIYIFCVVVLGFWVVWGWDYAASVLASPRRTTALKIPFYINQLPITVGMFGMAIYSVYHLVRNIIKKPSAYLLDNKYADEPETEEEGDEDQ